MCSRSEKSLNNFYFYEFFIKSKAHQCIETKRKSELNLIIVDLHTKNQLILKGVYEEKKQRKTVQSL